ncbi:hypothetical protein Nepgr_018231 [Nepenthes gracilis]|uniref:OCRE domain-containing protein n=1 Tax=Nepenthes gracilis TaxID=150966 RepID=A0AAD3SSZ4_NEPGR|nr:hypothetical protein Nepgr_018231 [Nepenthes gracilis]
MEESSSRKRHFAEDDDSNKPLAQKRVRFPKGKKVKPGTERVAVNDDNQERPKDWKDPRLASKERARCRSQMTTELFTGESEENLADISAAEVYYEDNEPFVEDGIHLEPFNLEKEREEGYFDPEGNFVEYVNVMEEKDAWLDSAEVDQSLLKERIANALERGETVLQALRRLKGHSNNKKDKMSAETKLIFDKLTEDAMKLMDNGDYDVYHEKQEVFEREAEGYESLAQARRAAPSISQGLGNGSSHSANLDTTYSTIPDVPKESYLNGLTSEFPSSNDAEAYDMFADEDGNDAANQSFEEKSLAPVSNYGTSSQMEVGNVNPDSEGSLAGQNDYMFDESSGYYYSSSLGYYYDPSSGLYCCAVSGQWYSFNEETGSYVEIQDAGLDASQC